MTRGVSEHDVEQQLAILQERVDSLVQANLTLASELWAVVDRQIMLEAVLSANGQSISDQVDHHAPDAALKERIDKRRNAFVTALTSELAG